MSWFNTSIKNSETNWIDDFMNSVWHSKPSMMPLFSQTHSDLYSHTTLYTSKRDLSSHTDLVRCHAIYSAFIISRELFWKLSDVLFLVGLFCLAAQHHGAEEKRWCETWHAHCCREAGDAYFTGRQTILRVSPVTRTLGRAAGLQPVVVLTLQLFCAPKTRLLKSRSSETWNSFTFHAFSCRLGAV